MTDVGPTNRTGDRRRRLTGTNAKTTAATATNRHVEFSDLPPPSAPARPSDSDYSKDDGVDATADALASLLDPTDGNASVSALSLASVDTECTEKAGNRTYEGGGGGTTNSRRNVPNRIGVRALERR